MTHLLSLFAAALGGPNPMAPGAAPFGAPEGVQINGQTVGAIALVSLECALGLRIPSGAYWYDPRSGLWGTMGTGAQGQILPWLPLGAPPLGCSGTSTGVFVNGREITHAELATLTARVGVVPLGRYFLEPDGRAGPEGGAAIVNLFARGGATGGAGQAGTFYQSGACGSVSGLYDPAGGSIVTVRDASGNATTWCP